MLLILATKNEIKMYVAYIWTDFLNKNNLMKKIKKN